MQVGGASLLRDEPYMAQGKKSFVMKRKLHIPISITRDIHAALHVFDDRADVIFSLYFDLNYC